MNTFHRLILIVALATPFLVSAVPQSAESAKMEHRSLELNEQGVRAVQSKDFARAEELFKEAIAIDAGNLTAVFNLGGMYLTNRNEPAAIALLENYVGKYPKDGGLHVRLGDAYFAAKEIDKALERYEAAFKIAPDYRGVSSKLGTLYALKNRLKEAEEMYERAVKQDPKNPDLYANLSSLHLNNGKPERAVDTAKQALQIRASPEVYMTLGNAYQQLKDYKNSLIAYQRARDLGAQDTELDAIVAELESRLKVS